jgi:serine phosphatase RsbU (regulator of sigma subunit)
VRARSKILALRIARDDLMRVAESTPSMLIGVISRLGDRIGRMGNAIALYTHALAALERQDAEANILLEELRNPIPDLADFAETFSRIAEQILLRRQRSDEMAAAAIVQRALLPNAEDFASETGVDIAAAMTPARDIGGDFFDLMKLEDGRIALGIGDVCGKGVPAALFMGITKSLIRINLREKPDLPGAITRANAFLINNNASDQFATALYAALDPATGEVEYCSCGHNAAFIRREGGRVETLQGGGLPIGVFHDLKMKVRRARLAPGDVLFLYTDGLTEANDCNGEEFGETRLSAIIAGANESAGDWVARAIAEVREFSRGLAPFDDLTCLAVRR